MKKFFKKAWLFLTGLFQNIDNFVNKYIAPSIEVVEKLKAAIDSPVADILVSITPTTIDDAALKYARQYLSKAITVLQVTNTCINKETPEEIILCFVEEVKKLSPEMQKGIWLRLASIMARLQSGREDVRGVHIDTLVQLHYMQKINAA